MPTELQDYSRQVAAQIRIPFRGTVAENCQRFRFVGSGYDAIPPEQNRHFELDSARQCTGPLAALQDSQVRIVHIIGATQVLKSLNGDVFLIYSIEHEQLPFLVLFEDDPKAELFCGRRLMDTIKAHPHIARMLDETKKESRHNVTGTWIKFIGFELLVAGLNDGNVSTLEWPRIWVSEAWIHGNDGLLFKAFKRADHFPDTCKILNESQASIAGTDLHTAVKDAHQAPLTWKCPACGGEQTWEWRHWSFKRPDDFKSTVPDSTAKPGTYGGMRWLDDEGLSIDRKAESAWWACIWCDHRIEDRHEVRMQLRETYRQDYQIERNDVRFSPSEVCFVVPWEAAVINRFKTTVRRFLIAKRAKEQGNELLLQDWFLQDRAYFYEKGQTTARELAPVAGSYDPKEKIPNQHSVNMLVDVQKDINAGPDDDVAGSFWVIIEAVDTAGNSWDLGRWFLTSWDELIALQRKFSIPCGRVCIDGRKWTTTIMRMAAENSEVVKEKTIYGREFHNRRGWMIFLGDDAAFFRWDRVSKPYSRPHAHPQRIVLDGRTISVVIHTHQWSNLAVSDQLHDIMLGSEGMPKIRTVARDQLDERTQAKEVGDFTYERQINAEYRTVKRGKSYWEKKRPENHYLDCRKMGLVRKMMDGLCGSVVDDMRVEETAKEAK